MFRLLFDGKSSESGFFFQALSMSLAGRVGTGNMHVATAIALEDLELYSGCGWLLLEQVPLLKLAQIYKEKHLGEFRGGPAFYIERGLGVKWFAVLFAVVSIISAGVLLPGVQANSVADGIQNAFEIDTWKSGIVVSLIFGAIVFGGVKESQIHRICRSIMAIIYIVIVLVIIVMISINFLGYRFSF
jgi:AGCS family alanine or glycine:cation symporter